jgi:hypothetical protein
MKIRRYLLIAGIVLATGACIAAFASAWRSGERFDMPYVYNELGPLITKDVEPERRWAEYAGGLELALTRVSSTWLLLD